MENGFEPVTWRKKYTHSSYSPIRSAYKWLSSLLLYLVVMWVFGGQPPRVTSSDTPQKNSVICGDPKGFPCQSTAQSIRWNSVTLCFRVYWRRVTKKRKKLKACHFVMYAGTSGSLTLWGQVLRQENVGSCLIVAGLNSRPAAGVVPKWIVKFLVDTSVPYPTLLTRLRFSVLNLF